MSFKSIALPAILAAGLLGAAGAQADTVYLNYSNTAIGLGPSMGTGNPFANRGALESLASVIDAETATTFEQHNQTTHVWVSGGTLELVFDFEIEYDLTTFHFWNYHSEGYDVDNIDLTFYDGDGMLVGTLLGVEPALGGTSGNDSTLIYAENYALAFPSNVRYVNAVLSGSNNQVDFNNMGFTGIASPAPIPEPETVALMVVGLLGVAGMSLRRRSKN